MPSRAEKKKARSGPLKTKTRPYDNRPRSGSANAKQPTPRKTDPIRVDPLDEPPALAPAYVLVILPAQDIRLPEVLRHIEAGRIVLVIPAPNAPR